VLFYWVFLAPQAVIRQMMKMRDAGTTYKQLAAWIAPTQEREMTLMDIKHTWNALGAANHSDYIK
jgi:hypothetical protein